MSQTTYTPDETVYIKGIGYTTLLSCETLNLVVQQPQAPPKKQSVHFDPGLFNPDNADRGVGEVAAQRRRDAQSTADLGLSKQSHMEINMVRARLDGAVLVYTPEYNLSRSVVVLVQCWLGSRKEQIAVEIQISKTIDTLKKAIFAQLNEQIAQFYDIRLFTCNPAPCELSVASKTVSQCLIKDYSKLTLTANYAFSFRPFALTHPTNSKYKLTLSNNTIFSSKIVEEQKKVETVQPKAETAEGSRQQKDESKEDKKQQRQQKTQKREQSATKQPNAPLTLLQKKISRIHAKCTISFSSGRHYWQIKLEKLPAEEQDLVIGICVQSQSKQTSGFWDCECAWGFMPLTGKEVSVERDELTNDFEEEIQYYGLKAKQNDTIGVLLRFMGKEAMLTFYKNGVSCGLAYCLATLSPQGQKREFVPFVNVGGECQVTLDPKASPPLDSYRLSRLP